jgi:O-6-methylguanine DNA methyltransferase
MIAKTEKPEIRLWLKDEGCSWFGVAECNGALVATSVAGNRDIATRILVHCLPQGSAHRLAEGSSAYADAMIRRLAAIEAGDESDKVFEIAGDYVPEPAASVFRLVAAIPRGYASSYGAVAKAAGTIAREVGRLMANNPLYPIVPCHRVVGSDCSLVGYRGMTSGPDLEDKLARLREEARGFSEERTLEGGTGLRVFPVEWVIAKAAREGLDEESQMTLW